MKIIGILKRCLVLALVVIQLASAQGVMASVAAAESGSNTRIVNLETNDMVDPLGIDVNPRFKWQMQSDAVGACQTAYQVVVSTDPEFENIVWDTGKVERGVSIGIEYQGAELTPSTRYYWYVNVWDNDGEQIGSEIAEFETGLLGSVEEAWAGSSWIKAGANLQKQPENLHYTVEGEFTVENHATGLVFNYIDDDHFLMWQINSDFDSDEGGGEADKVFIRPHRCNGGYRSYDDNHKVDITDLVGGVEELKETPMHLKVDVTETEIKTYVNDNLVDTMLFSEIDAPSAVMGKIGVRSNGDEVGTVRNLKLIDYSENEAGIVVYSYNFAAENPFGQGSVVDGAFVISGVGVCIAGNLETDTPIFRKSFSAAENIESARLYVTGQGVFDVWINGQRVGERQEDGSVVYDELKPGFTHTGTRVNSFAYDVTDMIESGDNAVSALVTPGWWSGDVVGRVRELAFRAKLLIVYENGETELIGTDSTWKYSYDSPVKLADIFAGETVDGNVETPWKESGYDDSGWIGVEVDDSEPLEITALTGPRVRAREDLEREPQSITVYDGATGAASDRYGEINVTGTYNAGDSFTIKPGEKAVVDFGQNFAGWPEIQVEGAKDTVVTIRHGEMVNDNDGLMDRGNDGPEGSIYTANLRTARAIGQYIMNGEGIETYHSSYTFYGFRYAEISATTEITVHNVRGIVLTSVETDTGSLTTSDDDVNQLISNIRWGMYSNYLSIPTDCPQRDERQGWTADTQVFAVTGAYNADVKGFFTKWMQDVRDSQNAKDGVFTDTAPIATSTRYGNVGWADAGIIVPYNMYKMYGDKSFILDNWQAMTTYMDFLETNNGPNAHWGDWLAPEGNDDELRSLLIIAYYAWDAQMMADMAEVIGYTDEAEKYRGIYESQKQRFIDAFVNDDGSLNCTKQTACIMALKMDLLPDDNSRETVKQQLIQNISNKGDRLQTGFLGTSVIMQTLSDVGASDTAYKLLLQHDNPSWLYTVDQGATTCWERWDSYTKDKGFGSVNMNSFNHYAYGAVGEWLYSYMAGIMYDFDAPGFKHIILKPTFGEGIDSVESSYDSEYGKIVSNWDYKNGNYVYDAQIPANITATVYLPTSDELIITVDGKRAENLSLETDGVEFAGEEDGYAVFNMAANSSHSFKSGYDESQTYKIAEVENLKDGKVSVQVDCRAETAVSAKLIAARYTNDILTGLEEKDISGSLDITLDGVFENDDTIKLFVWNNFDEMQPLSGTYTHRYEEPKEKPVVVYSPTYDEYADMFTETAGEKLTEVNGLGGYGELTPVNNTVTYTYNDIEYVFTKGWKQAGAGGTDSKCLYFTPTAPCTVTVVFDGNGSAGRDQYIVQNGSTLAAAKSSDSGAAIVQCRVTDTNNPVYTYGGGANKNVYAIIVEYDV